MNQLFGLQHRSRTDPMIFVEQIAEATGLKVKEIEVL